MRMKSLWKESMWSWDTIFTYAHFCLTKGIDSWFWKGNGDCRCSWEFGMDAGISWKKASKCFWRIAPSETLVWMGAMERTAGLWWGDRTALEDALSAFFSLHCCFSPLVDGVTGWELPTVLGFLSFCFSEEMSHFVKSLTCWLSPTSGVVTEGLWSFQMRQHPSLDSPCHGLLVGHPGRLGHAWEIHTWVFIQAVPRHVTQIYWF